MMGIDTIFRQNMKWRNDDEMAEDICIGPRGARGQKFILCRSWQMLTYDYKVGGVRNANAYVIIELCFSVSNEKL